MLHPTGQRAADEEPRILEGIREGASLRLQETRAAGGELRVVTEEKLLAMEDIAQSGH